MRRVGDHFRGQRHLSYISIRVATTTNCGGVLERLADFCFMLGLAALSGIAVLFAYEVI